MSEFLKSIIFALVYVGGRKRNYFSKKKDFIIIIMNPCEQEWASARLETQIWSIVGNPRGIFISHLRLFLRNCLLVHSICRLANSTSQDSQHNMASHGVTEGPNLWLCVSPSLSSNPSFRENIPTGPSSPINCEWSGE